MDGDHVISYARDWTTKPVSHPFDSLFFFFFPVALVVFPEAGQTSSLYGSCKTGLHRSRAWRIWNAASASLVLTIFSLLGHDAPCISAHRLFIAASPNAGPTHRLSESLPDRWQTLPYMMTALYLHAPARPYGACTVTSPSVHTAIPVRLYLVHCNCV